MKGLFDMFRFPKVSAENDRVGIVLGNVQVTNKTFENEEEAVKYLNPELPWDAIAGTIFAFSEVISKMDKEEIKSIQKED